MHAAALDPTSNVFTGRAGSLEQAGVAVQLTGWFRGAAPPAGVAWLDPAGFVDPMGGSCGTNPPTAGTEWIFVATRNTVGRYDMNLCSTAAALDTDQGQELLAEAVDVFGPPTTPAAPVPTAGADAGVDATDLVASVIPILLVALFAAGAILGVVGVIGRRLDPGRGGSDPER